MDDLRIQIWDYLYRLGRAQQIEIIAREMNEAPEVIRQVVNDPWFVEHDGMVAIAQTEREL